jgi:hypothetical protein
VTPCAPSPGFLNTTQLACRFGGSGGIVVAATFRLPQVVMCNTPPSPLGGKASLQVRVRVGVQHCVIGGFHWFFFCFAPLMMMLMMMIMTCYVNRSATTAARFLMPVL